MERGLISVDDLLDTLTRIASLAEFAQYRAHRQALNGIDCVARFEQIRDEALDAYERAEKGERHD